MYLDLNYLFRLFFIFFIYYLGIPNSYVWIFLIKDVLLIDWLIIIQ